MATCPRCKQQMDAYATRCPHCGYDFPLDDPNIEPILPRPKRSSFGFSPLAACVLTLGTIVSVIGLLGASVLLVAVLLSGSWELAFRALGAIFALLLQLVIIDRVMHIEP